MEVETISLSDYLGEIKQKDEDEGYWGKTEEDIEESNLEPTVSSNLYTPTDEFALSRFYEDRESSFSQMTASFYDPNRLPNDVKRGRTVEDGGEGEERKVEKEVEKNYGYDFPNTKRRRRGERGTIDNKALL